MTAQVGIDAVVVVSGRRGLRWAWSPVGVVSGAVFMSFFVIRSGANNRGKEF